MQVKMLINMQFSILGGDDCHVVCCLRRLFFWGRAFVFHGSIVATLGSRVYHWGAFMEAEILACGFIKTYRYYNTFLWNVSTTPYTLATHKMFRRNKGKLQNDLNCIYKK